ncbi:uncharacterized protein LOC117592111 isoform X4 [Drosophila guanche]|uniref:uncharacterized protein LOC117592111 isoform X4 n=1 Tax=Drosophila guanche TaxID=7266 RepID=UPI001471B876|nr:uncharacterized protein LOC117592111 isoform X4 [Drosophila guanche]
MFRLKWCCYCIGLRKGCIIIACLDFFINVTVATMGANYDYISRIEQAVAICHCIGCVFLSGGALLPTEIIRAADLLPHYQPHQLCHTDCLCHLHFYGLGARSSLHSAFCFGVHGNWDLLLAHCLLV